jgi:hypothetical protein
MTAAELGACMDSPEFSEWQAWYGFGCEPASARPRDEALPPLVVGDRLYNRLVGIFGRGKK